MNLQDKLKNLQPTKEFFVGIDSDGCAFDTMEIKQKECFCPNFIKHFELQKVQKYAREIWEFVNLYSKTRGVNRFLAVIEAFRQIKERDEVQARGFVPKDIKPLIEWTEKESKLGIPALVQYASVVNDEIINVSLNWAKEVNKDIAEMVYGMPPFPWVR